MPISNTIDMSNNKLLMLVIKEVTISSKVLAFVFLLTNHGVYLDLIKIYNTPETCPVLAWLMYVSICHTN